MKRRIAALLLTPLLTLVALAAAQGGTLETSVMERESGAPVAQAVVLARPLGTSPPQRKSRLILVDQVDKEFVSQITLIQVGDRINFPNSDDIDHHVYSFSAPKQFELPLYKEMPETPILFDQPGVVKIGCNIHDWMVGYIYVADTPYAALTDPQGRVSLPDLPAGEYEVQLWHPRMERAEEQSTRTLSVPGGSETLAVSWQIELRPDFRPRRAPLRLRRSY